MQKIERKTAEDFLIRCSAINDIAGGSIGMTEVQKRDLKDLREKQASYKEKGKELANGDQTKLNALMILETEPVTLPKGAKTYVEKWVKENIIFLKKKTFGNKYTKKGNDNEDDGIELFAEYLDLGEISKNTERKYDEFFEGETDIALAKCIVDIKNSYTHETFPIFETEVINRDYYGQVQGYMKLWDKPFALLVYVLTDAGEELLLKEAQALAYTLNMDEVTEELYEYVKEQMTYSDVPLDCRIKIFRIERNDYFIADIEERVKLCRKYAKKLIDDFKENRKLQKTFL